MGNILMPGLQMRKWDRCIKWLSLPVIFYHMPIVLAWLIALPYIFWCFLFQMKNYMVTIHMDYWIQMYWHKMMVDTRSQTMTNPKKWSIPPMNGKDTANYYQEAEVRDYELKRVSIVVKLKPKGGLQSFWRQNFYLKK